MKQDIHKLGVWLERVCREGVAVEQKVTEWKLAEEKKHSSIPQAKAS
jgi:hypothetical protein